MTSARRAVELPWTARAAFLGRDTSPAALGWEARVIGFFGQYAIIKIRIVKEKNPKKTNSSMPASSHVSPPRIATFIVSRTDAQARAFCRAARNNNDFRWA